LNIPPIEVRSLLRQYNLRPDKRLGQVFLTDNQSLRRIIRAAQISPEDHVLEIGPGVGSLTRHLAQVAKLVVAVELDTRLIPPLEKVIAPYANVRLINDDILRLDPTDLMVDDKYQVVANIPYYITSQLIRYILETKTKPKNIILTIQHEVAERICAEPNDMSLLSLSVQVYGQPKIPYIIPAKSFYPKPKVDSAVVRIDLYSEPLIPTKHLGNFFQLAKSGFSQKRKTLRNSISAGLAIKPEICVDMLQRAHIDPQRRAETLSINEWRLLTLEYNESIKSS
jgi:16S rRNA (adenine1518-N6/adenine1519-N6)-dimethyltransferase